MIRLPHATRIPSALSRRALLRGGLQAGAYLALAQALGGCASAGAEPAAPAGRLREVGPLGAALGIGIRIPQGFTARVVARAGLPVGDTGFIWHTDPDGSACFASDDGGWIYASNREFVPGGVNAMRFDSRGSVVAAYNCLPGALTRMNCSGGATPWQTWLSGEEYDLGVIWECDPYGKAAPTRLPALGVFAHEAAAVDPKTNIVYLTEDKPDGRFYRFVSDTPNVGGKPDLQRGRLQALQVHAPQATVDQPGLLPATRVSWLDVPVPSPQVVGATLLGKPLREQLPDSTAFRGGEGVWHHAGFVYFTTKGDCRVWALDLAAGRIATVYDDALHPQPILDSVDNIIVTPGGDLIVVEDKDEANQQAVAITQDGRIFPLIELAGQEGSEVTGPAFSPDGRHFYFSSQRGPGARTPAGTAGITYCVSGPWFT